MFSSVKKLSSWKKDSAATEATSDAPDSAAQLPLITTTNSSYMNNGTPSAGVQPSPMPSIITSNFSDSSQLNMDPNDIALFSALSKQVDDLQVIVQNLVEENFKLNNELKISREKHSKLESLLIQDSKTKNHSADAKSQEKLSHASTPNLSELGGGEPEANANRPPQHRKTESVSMQLQQQIDTESRARGELAETIRSLIKILEK